MPMNIPIDPELSSILDGIEDIPDINIILMGLIRVNIIKDAISNNQYSEKTISKLQDAIRVIRLANCYFYHFDALLSNIHTEESFRTELIKDLQQI